METKHSGFGIASFTLAILIGIGIFFIIGFAGILMAINPNFLEDDQSASSILVGLFIIGFLAIDVIAFSLGVAGCCLPNRKKVFAILGTIFSLLIPLGMIILAIIGNYMD
ncbi:MAG: hypothetical protein LBV12_05585 [Puniceicoccales bacterium]|jgi:hypothetical protein|nr:hypothetical protein [Puniceicoccales bacterium]